MTLSVGPIESYIPGSTWFDLTKYSDLGTQEQVSVNLTDSNLWLVDESQLNFQDSLTSPVVSADQASLVALSPEPAITDINSPSPSLGGRYVPESSAQITALPLETGGTVTFSGVNGEIDSDAAAIEGVSDRTSISVIQMQAPMDLSAPSDSDSPLFTTAYSNPEPSTTSESSATPINPAPIPTPVDVPGGSNPPSDPVPVPFGLDATTGLLLLGLLFSRKLYKRYTLMQTVQKRDRITPISKLEITAQ